MRKSNWKKKAWDAFSLYVRLRDCLETTGTQDYGLCITCGTKHHFKDLQAGHCIPGRGNSILLDDTLVAAQCRRCNVFQNGQHGIFALRMIDKWGRKYYEEALMRAKQPKPMKQWEWQEQYEFWTKKYEGLKTL
jgi:hypothetical protein